MWLCCYALGTQMKPKVSSMGRASPWCVFQCWPALTILITFSHHLMSSNFHLVCVIVKLMLWENWSLVVLRCARACFCVTVRKSDPLDVSGFLYLSSQLCFDVSDVGRHNVFFLVYRFEKAVTWKHHEHVISLLSRYWVKAALCKWTLKWTLTLSFSVKQSAIGK